MLTWEWDLLGSVLEGMMARWCFNTLKGATSAHASRVRRPHASHAKRNVALRAHTWQLLLQVATCQSHTTPYHTTPHHSLAAACTPPSHRTPSSKVSRCLQVMSLQGMRRRCVCTTTAHHHHYCPLARSRRRLPRGPGCPGRHTAESHSCGDTCASTGQQINVRCCVPRRECKGPYAAVHTAMLQAALATPPSHHSSRRLARCRRKVSAAASCSPTRAAASGCCCCCCC
jgi:hypothetical protein